MSTATSSRISAAGSAVRNAWLDVLRAWAALSVIVYHSVQMSPAPLPNLARVTHYGQFGVDLFFVLSGWLIGGLYWREANASGSVHVMRFWTRRWMRTLPPYFAALAASWLAVRAARGEPFDWGYLVFLQNYYDQMPFFLVSWSLCIEEHFYILAPLAAALLLQPVPSRFRLPAWILAIAISPVARWLAWSPDGTGQFGYSVTATHLRLDGLVLGFGLSHVATFAPTVLLHGERWSLHAIPFLLVALTSLELTGGALQYILWPLAIACLFAAILIAGRERDPEPARGVRRLLLIPWTPIALASYSAYLVHPLAIHAARRVASTAGEHDGLAYWPLVALLITAATWAFYRAIERPAIALRDAWVPARRTRKRSEGVLIGPRSS